uniref:Family 18 glycoside hydrolase n=1 Tax=Phakopsora pachyrhizi TaxID=170000 RepID=A0A0S1MKB5_PHAPC
MRHTDDAFHRLKPDLKNIQSQSNRQLPIEVQHWLTCTALQIHELMVPTSHVGYHHNQV